MRLGRMLTQRKHQHLFVERVECVECVVLSVECVERVECVCCVDCDVLSVPGE